MGARVAALRDREPFAAGPPDTAGSLPQHPCPEIKKQTVQAVIHASGWQNC